MKRALLLGCLAVGACGGDDAPVAPPPPSNQPPVATGSPFPQNTSVDVGQSVEVELSTYFSDPDGDALTYAATTTAPDILAVTVTGSVLRITGAGAGTASVTATARDPGGLSASLTFTATVVVPNRAPETQGSISDQALTVRGSAATVDVSGNFTDPDGDTLSYTVASSDDGVATANVSGAMVTVTPVGPGTATVTVTARDPGGLSASLTFTGTVSASTSPDLVVRVAPVRVTVAAGSSFRFTVTIRNQGAADAAATVVRTFESADTVITTSDDQTGDPTDVPALDAGESADGTVTVRVGRSALPGTIHLGQCVDPVEGESNTGNNCSSALEIVVLAKHGDTTDDTAGQLRPARPDSAGGRIVRIDRFRFFLTK